MNIPYRSQWDTDAPKKNDCGATCCGMLAESRGIDQPTSSYDNQSDASGMTNATNLVQNLADVGLDARTVMLAVNAPTPRGAICLVWYGGFNRSSVQDTGFTGWHWLILLEETADYVTVHDPDWWGSRREEGANKRYTRAEWNAAFKPYPGDTQKTCVVLSEAIPTMTARNPVGIHRQNMQTPDEAWLIQMCKDCQFTTVTCLDAAVLTGRVQSEGDVPYAIYRAWGFEPNPGDRTGEALKQFAREVYGQIRGMVNATGNGSTHINLNCEQGHAPQRIRMYTEIMHLNAADPNPVGIVFLNDFIGGIPTGFWGQSNEFETDYFMEFIRVFDQYRNLRLASGSYAHVFGVHNYTKEFAWIAVNGGQERGKPINWNTANNIQIDWTLAQDHLGREYQGIRRALKYTWDNSTRQWSASANTPKRADGSYIEPPWIIWTEALFDDVTGVPTYAQPIDHNQRSRGYHSVKTWWENTAFPEDDGHGHTLAKMAMWVWNRICQDGYTIGWNMYTLGDTGGWESFNTGRKEGTDGGVDPDYDYWDEMKTYRVEMPAHFFDGTSAPPDTGDGDNGEQPPVTTKIDLLPYFTGLPTRHKYELGHNAAMGGGTELLQTQGETTDARIFRHVKQGGASPTSKWERLCNTDNYIYRDLDTSGDVEVYRLSDAGKPWSKWCPRYMAVGEKFHRNPTVTWINKQSGQVIGTPRPDPSDIQLVSVMPTMFLPESGITLTDVIQLAWYPDGATAWEERYYYGKNYGLVAWENRAGWRSYVSVAQSPHPAPVPEQLGAWANPPPVPTDSAPIPPQPPTQPAKPANAADPVTFTVSASYKLRMAADTSAQQIGVLKAGETVKAYRVPETTNDGEVWHFIERTTTPPNEAAQGYSAVPLPAPVPPEPEPEPPDSIDIDALKVVYEHVIESSNELHQISLQVATISDELKLDADILKAIIEKHDTPETARKGVTLTTDEVAMCKRVMDTLGDEVETRLNQLKVIIEDAEMRKPVSNAADDAA